MFAVLLDADVLVPTALCDTLLRFAETGFYRPLWSDRLLLETEEAILRLRPSLGPAAIRRRSDRMRATFEDATVTRLQQVSAGLDLPDQDGRRVLAAAIAGGAQAIVTVNLRDFPAAAPEDRGIEARHPDDFLLDQLDLSPSRALVVLQQQAEAPAADRPRRSAQQPGAVPGARLRGSGTATRARRPVTTETAAAEPAPPSALRSLSVPSGVREPVVAGQQGRHQRVAATVDPGKAPPR